jgi:hypothetical protein
MDKAKILHRHYQLVLTSSLEGSRIKLAGLTPLIGGSYLIDSIDLLASIVRHRRC